MGKRVVLISYAFLEERESVERLGKMKNGLVSTFPFIHASNADKPYLSSPIIPKTKDFILQNLGCQKPYWVLWMSFVKLVYHLSVFSQAGSPSKCNLLSWFTLKCHFSSWFILWLHASSCFIICVPFVKLVYPLNIICQTNKSSPPTCYCGGPQGRTWWQCSLLLYHPGDLQWTPMEVWIDFFNFG